MPALTEQISPDGLPLQAAQPDKEVVIPPSKEDGATDNNEGAEDTVDFSQFLNAKDKPLSLEESPKPEDKKDEIVDDKKEVIDDKKVEQLKVDTSKKQSQKIDLTGRDYSDIPEELVPAMKKMSNESFAAVKPIIIARKQLEADHAKIKKDLEDSAKKITELSQGKQSIPDNYYENENAYLLMPEFHQEARNQQLAENILNHWVEQLNNIREGAKEIQIPGVDQQGNLTITHTAAADQRTETKVQLLVNNAQKQLWEQTKKVNDIQSSFKQSATQVQDFVKQEMSKSFAFFETEDGKKTYGPLIDDVVSKLPPPIRNSVSARWLATSLVLNGQLAQLLKQAAAERANGGADKQTVDPKKKQPTAAEVTSENNQGNDEPEVSMDDFRKRMKE